MCRGCATHPEMLVAVRMRARGALKLPRSPADQRLKPPGGRCPSTQRTARRRPPAPPPVPARTDSLSLRAAAVTNGHLHETFCSYLCFRPFLWLQRGDVHPKLCILFARATGGMTERYSFPVPCAPKVLKRQRSNKVSTTGTEPAAAFMACGRSSRCRWRRPLRARMRYRRPCHRLGNVFTAGHRHAPVRTSSPRAIKGPPTRARRLPPCAGPNGPPL